MRQSSPEQKGSMSLKRQRNLVILVFSAIPVLLLVLFTYLPFEKMIEFSFFKMKYLGPREFVGLDNYKNVFTRKDTLKALLNSFYYVGSGLLELALALLFANILCGKVRGKNFFKATLFFPYLICGLAVGFIFRFFYTRGAVLDSFLHFFGIPLDKLPYWLKDQKINNFSIAFTSLWRYTGRSMVLFIGAIQSVSPEYFEASSIDGATKWQQFRYITMPTIRPIVMINVMLSIKGAFSAFEGPFVVTYGLNGTATSVVIMHQLAHEFGKVGLASAMAIVLLAIILLLSWLQQKLYNHFFKEA
jgi:ABC-type sugar transport system permease subunit